MESKIANKKLIAVVTVLVITVISIITILAFVKRNNMEAMDNSNNKVVITAMPAVITVTPFVTITPEVHNEQAILSSNLSMLLSSTEYTVTLQSTSEQCTTVVQTVNGNDFENSVAGYHLATDKIVDCSTILFKEKFTNGKHSHNNGNGWKEGIYAIDGVTSPTAKKIVLSEYINADIQFKELNKTSYGYEYKTTVSGNELVSKNITIKFDTNLKVTQVDTVTKFGTDILTISAVQ